MKKTGRPRLRARLAHFIANRPFFLRLAAHNASVRDAKRTDPLTGCLNRGAFAEEAFRILSATRRHPAPLTLLIVDIDHFAAVNDEFGPVAGDLALYAVAAVLFRNIREIDLLCRFAGNQFAVLLPESGLCAALLVSQRIRRAVAAELIPLKGRAHRRGVLVTISVGVTLVKKHDVTIFDAIERGQKALLQAKQSGRNRVETLEQVEELLADGEATEADEDHKKPELAEANSGKLAESVLS